LAVFCGKIYTRYHAQMNPAPVLEYVARQLKRNRSVELIVLQQLMQSMAGVNPETNLNDAQLQALAGGEMLRKQTLKAFRDKRAEDTDETMRTLTNTLANEKLAAQLLILIAQERQTSIFRIEESSAPLKVLANLFDEIHVVLSQYLDLMKLGFTPERFEEVVPSVGDLVQKYGIEPSVAWWIYRLGLRSRMSRSATETEDVEMKDIPAEPTTDATPVAKSHCHPVLEKMVDEIKPILPEAVWAKLSISFYITFWQLEIHDIFVPIEAYGAEQKRIMSAVETNKNDRSDMSIAGQERRKIRGQQLQNDLDLLNAEVKNHMKHHQAIRRRLTAEKEMWFRDDRFNQREITDAVIEHCLFPRVMISPNDASFCSRFIREVHRMGTPKFHTIGVYDAIFGRGLSTVIFICTQREAENYGRFLKEILQDLHAWHADRNVYEKEAHGTNKGLVGFFVKGQPFDYEDFRKILYKWHKTLHTAVKNCLSSKEYMHIRNAIVVLKHVVDYFPAVDWIGRTVVEKVEDLVKSEKREDLKIAAMTLLGMLKKKEKDWMIVAAFQKSEAVAPGMMKPSPTPLADNGKPSSPVPPPPQQQINQQPQQQPQQPPPPPQPQQTSRPPSALAKEFRPMATRYVTHPIEVINMDES
jgi:THO complex subunit 2